MYHTEQKAQFSLAYVHAIASVAGFNLGSFHVDDDSVDVILKTQGLVGTVRRPHLNLQLKCTQNLSGDPDHWSFKLKRKNYEDLREDDCHVSTVLVVLHVPEAQDEWLVHGEDHMKLCRRAYWLSLRGRPPLPAGMNSVTIKVPRCNVFDVEGLVGIVEAWAKGLL